MKIKLLSPLLLIILSASLTAAKEPCAFESMTPREKIGQMLLVTMNADIAYRYKNVIESGLAGGVLIQWGSYSITDTKKLTDKLQSWAARSRCGLPLFIAADYEGGGAVFGPVTLGLAGLPTNMALGAANRPADTAMLFYLAGAQLSKAGINVSFAPVADVNTASKNPAIGTRSFGSYPDRVAEMSAAAVNGLRAAGIIAVAKHFPGQGAAETDSHKTRPTVKLSLNELQTTHFPPFELLAESSAPAVMSAHVLYPALDTKEPATFSKKILTGLLRKKMKFNGLVFSDSLDMKGATGDRTIADAAVAAANAGADVLLVGYQSRTAIPEKIISRYGRSLEKNRVEESARRIYDEKMRLAQRDAFVETPADMTFNAISAAVAKNSATIVRSRDLPLSPAQHTSACVISFAPSRYASDIISMGRIFYSAGIKTVHFDATERPGQKETERALDCERNADFTVIGSFQWSDKTSARQVKAIKRLLAEKKKTVLLSLMSPYDTARYPEAENAVAIYGLNEFSASAAAEVIIGRIKAAGLLPVRLPDRPFPANADGGRASTR